MRFRVDSKPHVWLNRGHSRHYALFLPGKAFNGLLTSDDMTVGMRIRRLIAFFFRSLLWSLNLLLVVYTGIAYWLLYSLQTEHWLAGLILISIPVAWVLNIITIGLWLTTRPQRSWLSGVAIIVGILLFGSRTFVWHSPTSLDSTGTALKVFSYNAHWFGAEDLQGENADTSTIRRNMDYVLQYDAPVKCFQEFYSTSTIPSFNLAQQLHKAGYLYSVVLHPELENALTEYAGVGVALFSVYPIVSSGREIFDGHNGLVWANIKVKNDTIRIINLHLHSMGIRVGRVLKQQGMQGVQHETHGVLSALRTGFIDRNEEVRRVERYIRESPYPVIVTGDHNDTPYSVVYERLRRTLPSSFEDAGRGFGFSYNRLPGFIRIDHQFHDPSLSVLNFETLGQVKNSDHYPIAGTYLVK